MLRSLSLSHTHTHTHAHILGTLFKVVSWYNYDCRHSQDGGQKPAAWICGCGTTALHTLALGIPITILMITGVPADARYLLGGDTKRPIRSTSILWLEFPCYSVKLQHWNAAVERHAIAPHVAAMLPGTQQSCQTACKPLRNCSLRTNRTLSGVHSDKVNTPERARRAA